MEDQYYMTRALELARKAYDLEETPIGCVIVYQDQIIGEGYNRRNKAGSALAHAEIDAIAQASEFMKDWRLEECTMYVTLEPCPMCAGAIVQSRIPKVVIGAMNPKAGCAGSILNLLQEPDFNHQAEIVSGVMVEESRALLQQFFRSLRERDKKRKQKKEEGETL